MNFSVKKTIKLLLSNMSTAAGFIISIFFIILAVCYVIFGNRIVPYNPQQMNLFATNLSPSLNHLFGTDNLGRDIFSRVLAGIPIDIGISLFIVLVSALVGLFLGIIAGYFRGIIEEVIMRVTDIFLAFPALLMSMMIAATIGPSLLYASLSLIFVWWPPYVRLVRGNTLQVTALDFITMSKILNTPFRKILLKGILPNITTTLLIYATLDIGSAILDLSTMGYLGIGIPVNSPELGMMASIMSVNFYTYPLEGLIPAFFIFILVMGFSLMGEGLTQLIDPNIRTHLISRKQRVKELEKIKVVPAPS
jgi:peptide/nickel transport system permease protein